MVGSRVRGHGGCRGRSSGSTDADNYAKYVLPFFQRIWSIMEKYWLVFGLLVLLVGSRVRGHGGCRGRSRPFYFRCL